MENEIDLTEVDPARWPEIRRRVAILDQYVRMRRPDAVIRKQYADMLDISPPHLLLLARIWRKERSAAALPGAKAKVRVAKPRRLPARAIELTREVISDFGPLSRLKDVAAEAGRRCAVEGHTPPSKSSISNMIIEARTSNAATDLEPEILIDECVLKIPVVSGDTLAMPRALLAVALPQRRIVGVDIAFDPAASTSLAKVMADIESASKRWALSLPLRAPHRTRLECEIIGAARGTQGTGKPTLAKVLGSRLGDIRIAHKFRNGPKIERLLGTRLDAAIGTADAKRAIMAAIARHNDRMPALPPSTSGLASSAKARAR